MLDLYIADQIYHLNLDSNEKKKVNVILQKKKENVYK